MAALSIVEREAILDKEISSYVKGGYKVLHRTQTTAQLQKDAQHTKLGSCMAIVLTLGLWILVEMLMAMFGLKDQKQVYIVVEEDGKVTKTSRKLKT